ncbi:MAG: ATP-binding protein [Bacteroidales bacterium]|nr:ATP-binding protein [Bacteroidales bacterium]
MKIILKNKNRILIPVLLMNFFAGFSQSKIPDTEKQKIISWNQSALEASASGNNVAALADFNKIAKTYEQYKDYNNAEIYYKKALSEAKKQNASFRTISAYFHLINTLKIQKKWNESLQFENEKIELSRKSSKKALVNDLINRAYTLKMLKKYNNAITDLEEAKKIAQFEIKNEQLTFNCYKELANNYKLLGNEEKYNEYHNLVERIKTEKTTSDLKNKTTEAQIKAQIKEQELQKTSSKLNLISDSLNTVADSLTKMEAIAKMQQFKLEAQNERIARQELQLQIRRNIIYFLIAFLIFAIIAAILWYIQYKKKKEALKIVQLKNEEIHQQKEEIQAQADELEFQRDELYRSNKTKEKLLSVVAHDLKNPIHALIGFSELLIDKEVGLSEDEKTQYAEYIYDSSLQIYSLLENLLKWAQSQSSSIKYQPEKFNFNELLEINIKLFHEAGMKKEIELIFNSKTKNHVYADKNMINTVIRNLINNAIKFTTEGGKISVSAKDKNDFVEISIVDTGVGMTEDIVKKILETDEFHSSQGTSNEQGTGLGLAICKEFLNAHNSKLQILSRPNKGSTFYFKIPIAANS